MPRIRCHYTECIFVDDGYCGAAAVEFDPDTGCATFSPNEEAAGKEANWEEQELEEWEEEEGEEDEEDAWEEEEDEI